MFVRKYVILQGLQPYTAVYAVLLIEQHNAYLKMHMDSEKLVMIMWVLEIRW